MTMMMTYTTVNFWHQRVYCVTCS